MNRNEELSFDIKHDFNLDEQFELEGKNRDIAFSYINGTIRLIDFLKENDKIPNIPELDLKNIVYKIESENAEVNGLSTCLFYRSLTPTGKMPRNSHVLSYIVLLNKSDNLINGIYYEKEDINIYSENRLEGKIVFKLNGEVSYVKNDIFYGDTIYRMETKNINTNSMEEIEFWAPKRNLNIFEGTINFNGILETIKKTINKFNDNDE